jgi:hypothetical protein
MYTFNPHIHSHSHSLVQPSLSHSHPHIHTSRTQTFAHTHSLSLSPLHTHTHTHTHTPQKNLSHTHITDNPWRTPITAMEMHHKVFPIHATTPLPPPHRGERVKWLGKHINLSEPTHEQQQPQRRGMACNTYLRADQVSLAHGERSTGLGVAMGVQLSLPSAANPVTVLALGHGASEHAEEHAECENNTSHCWK